MCPRDKKVYREIGDKLLKSQKKPIIIKIESLNCKFEIFKFSNYIVLI